MNIGYFHLLNSPRVLPATRRALMQRREQTDNYEPVAIRSDLYEVLQAVLRRLIPQDDRPDSIDIAARLDEQHAQGKGNGWRYADMPADKQALELGLALLDQDCRKRLGGPFAGLSSDIQDGVLSEAQKGQAKWRTFNSRRWFEELLSDAVSIFASHPDTLAEIGFSGIAILPRWDRIGLNNREAWEPQARQAESKL